MLPDALEIGPINIAPMGFALALGFGLAVWLAVKRAKENKVPGQLIKRLSILVLFSGLIGSKLFYAVFHWAQVSASPIDFLKSGLSGSGVYGAVFLASPVAVFYLHRHSQNLWQALDVITPSLALLVGLGRLGCFASGCCFGKPTESGIGLVFASNSPAGALFPGEHLIPTQLLAASTAFVLVAVTLLVDRKKSFYGLTFCTMMILYGLGRFTIDFFRFYENQMVLFSIGSHAVPPTQILSLILSLTGLGLLLYLKK